MVGRCEFKQIWPQAVSTMGDIERFGLEENTIGRKKCSRKINVRREFLFLFNTLYFFVVHLFPISTLSSCQDHGCDCVRTSTMLLLFFWWTSIVHRPSSIVHRLPRDNFFPPGTRTTPPHRSTVHIPHNTPFVVDLKKIYLKLQASKSIYFFFLPLLLFLSFLDFLDLLFSCNTFFTIFCSSIRNARTILALTAAPERDPP